MADRSVVVRLRAEIGQYKQAMAEASKATAKVGDEGEKASKQGKDFVSNWSQAGKPLLAVGGAMTALTVSVLKTGIAYNQLQQTSRAALTTLLGSAQAANAQMDRLDDFARSSPFSKSVFITAQQQMLAFGIETQKVLPYLDAIQDAVAAAGGGNHDISELARIMSQIHASAKITATDLREFGNRGVDAASLIGEAMGMTGAQIRESITAGTLDADAALDALAKGMATKFDGAADNVKNTFAGALDRVSAAWRDLSSEMAEPLVGKEGGGVFTALLNELADFMRAVEGLPGPVKLAGGAIFALTGLVTLSAGAFLTFAPRIVATKAALATLEQQGSRSAVALGRVHGALGRVSRAAGVAAAAYAALEVAFVIDDKVNSRNVNELDKLAKSLERYAETGAASGEMTKEFGKGLGGFGAAVSDFEKSSSKLVQAGSYLPLVGGIIVESFGDPRQARAIQETSDQIVKLHKSDPAAAAAALAQLREEALKGGATAAEFENAFSAAVDLIGEIPAVAEDSADAVISLADAQKQAAEAAKQFNDALDALLGTGMSYDKAAIAWRDSLADLAKQVEDTGTSLDIGTDKGRRNREAIMDTVSALKDRIKTEAELNGEDAAVKVYERGREALLREAEAAGFNRAEVEKLVTQYGLVPDLVETAIRANDEVTRVINTIQAGLYRLSSGVTVPVSIKMSGVVPNLNDIYRRTDQADGGLWTGRVRQYASGGIDEFGRPVQRVPQIRSGTQGAVMWGEPETGWEAYVSGKPSQKPRNRAILGEAAARLGGSVQWFADGGFTEAVTGLELTRMQIRVRDLKRSLKETEEYGKKPKGGKRPTRLRLRGLDRREALQELRDAEADLKEQQQIRRRMKKAGDKTSGQYNRRMKKAEDKADEAKRAAEDATENRKSVASSFADGLSGDSFKSPATLERALSNMLRDSSEFTGLLADLRKKGASPWLLEQLVKAGPSRATNRTARALLADSARLGRLNAMSSGIVTGANSYAALVTQPGFSATYSGAGPSAIGEAISIVKQAMGSANFYLVANGYQVGRLVQEGQKRAEEKR